MTAPHISPKAPLSVIVKSFHNEWGDELLTEVFRGVDIGTCFSINETISVPTFPAKKHLWMSPKAMRGGRYPQIDPNVDVSLGDLQRHHALINPYHVPMTPKIMRAGIYPKIDWAEITPLDEELIEKMYGCEPMFLSMVERYARHGDMPYAERKRQYLAHLRFWNHVMETEKIGLFLAYNSPHQAYDYVIYELCKMKSIPVYYLEHCNAVNGMFILEDFEESAKQLVPIMADLRREYADPAKKIPLTPWYEQFYEEATTKGSKPMFVVERDRHLTKQSFFAKWGDRALAMIRKKPMKFLEAAVSPNVWARKFAQHKTALYYDLNAVMPDLTKPFVYAPLHMQPEDAATPRGGEFRDQELLVQLLAARLPKGVRIYVKEHPAQGELYRNEEFYRSMKEIPSVSFIHRKFDTFELIRRCKAVATLSGTAGFEALFFGKPTLMFGHRFYQYAPGVHMVRSVEDCDTAIESIFEKNETPSLRDMRLFLKALQDNTIPHYWKPMTDQERIEERNQVVNIGRKIRETIEPIFP